MKRNRQSVRRGGIPPLFARQMVTRPDESEAQIAALRNEDARIIVSEQVLSVDDLDWVQIERDVQAALDWLTLYEQTGDADDDAHVLSEDASA